MKVLVTGGAGFIGSHLVDVLVAQGQEVTIIDNLSTGHIGNLATSAQKEGFTLIKADLKTPLEWADVLEGIELVYHFAANPEVRKGEESPELHFNENVVATFNLLEAMRKSRTSRSIVFASTSTIYGEPTILPTPENYGPLFPISTYGASKLGSEAIICSYAYTFGLRALNLRLGNVVGSRNQRGVIIDLIKKLKADSSSLEILGDGTQRKSYLHVTDCIAATLFVTTEFLSSSLKVDAFNVSSADQVSVKRIAEIVAEEMRLPRVAYKFTGGVDGGRGWMGDVKEMHLAVGKLQALGWKPDRNSEQAVRLATQELLASADQ
jgi:UDP-glucose 4-epimerase